MMSVRIRAAGPQDVTALVRLRLANAQHHVELGPRVHRLPDTGAVRAYFTDRLRGGEDGLILLAEVDDDEVVGMAEIVVRPDPPAHQILVPRRVAEVHTVIRSNRAPRHDLRTERRRRPVLHFGRIRSPWRAARQRLDPVAAEALNPMTALR
jgi:hypothetical protein